MGRYRSSLMLASLYDARTVADCLDQDAAITQAVLVCRGERAMATFRRAVATAGA